MTANGARILVVDDEDIVTDVITRMLESEGYEVRVAADGDRAVEMLDAEHFDLTLLDIKLPGRSGVDVLKVVAEGYPETAAVMISGVDERTTANECLQLGAHSYVIKPFDQNDVLLNVAAALEERKRLLASRDEQRRLEVAVRERTSEIRRREEEIALRLVAAAEFRDEESSAHIRRIGMFAEVMVRALGWRQEEAHLIRVAAPMHDIGKIGIADGILLKPGELTVEEFEVAKTHTIIGARLLTDSDIPVLQLAEKIARSHHERWDGAGYPDGLEGEEIPPAARIVKIADVYDSLTHARHYRPAFGEQEALSVMQEEREQFDPTLFEVFLDSLPAFRRIHQKVADEVG